MKPYDAKTERDRIGLQRDNFPPKNGVWSILLSGGHVSLHSPEGGWVEIPRKQFNALVDWYLADQKPVKPERRRASTDGRER
jgi:hypothetical protein